MVVTENKKLHIVMFPWLGFGHLLPFLELAKLIAQKGHKITFVSTTRNIERLPKLPENLTHLIDLVKLTLPHEKYLPENAEATSDVSLDKAPFLKKAFNGLEKPMTKLLEAARPDWIVYDLMCHWMPSIAAKLNISRAFLSLLNACTVSFLQPTSPEFNEQDTTGSSYMTDYLTSKPKWITFPTKVRTRFFEVMRLLPSLSTEVSEMFQFKTLMASSDVFIIRSWKELDLDWLNLLQKLHGKPIIPIGLMLRGEQAIGASENDDKSWLQICQWLEKHNTKSVIYISFGSECAPTQEELKQLALGLELSGLAFFWGLRKQSMEQYDLKLPDGFEERTKNRGMIWSAWAPQVRILAHKSVGGFLTHGGWSSCIEGVQLGHPLIVLPTTLEQGLNARYMEEKMVGIELPRDEQYGTISSDSVAKTLRLVMVDEEGKIYRDKAKEMMKIITNKKLMDQHVDELIEYLQEH